MKKIVISLILVLSFVEWVFGATTGGIKKHDSSGNLIKNPVIYYRVTSDFNDANSCMATDVYLDAVTYTIDTNGTELSFQILIMYDPPEANATDITKLYTLATIEVNSVECPLIGKVAQSRDVNDNPYGTIPIGGDIYIGRRNASDAAGLQEIKAYLNLDND